MSKTKTYHMDDDGNIPELEQDPGYLEWLDGLNSSALDEEYYAAMKPEANMTNVNDLYPSKSSSLKAADLKGKAVKVIIDGFDVADFDNGRKAVLKFKDKEKGLVLNKTNAMILSSHFGDDMESWNGKEIIVYPDKTSFGGEIVDCLRVRVEAPLDDMDEAIPF